MFLFKFFFVFLFFKQFSCITLVEKNFHSDPLIEFKFDKGWFENNFKTSIDKIFEFNFIDEFKVIYNEKFAQDLIDFEINLDFYFLKQQFDRNEKFYFFINTNKREKILYDKNIWFNYNKKFQINKNFNFKLEIFERFYDKLNIEKLSINKKFFGDKTFLLNSNNINELNKQEKKIYIKNFYLKIKLIDEKEFNLIKLFDENIFEISIDKKIIKKEPKEYSFLPEFKKNLDKYYYSTQNSISFTWKIENITPDSKKDICLNFDYYVKRSSSIKLKFLNKLKTNYLLLTDLSNTEIKNENSNSFEWLNFKICLRDLYFDTESIENYYKFKFETNFEDNLQSLGFVAISDIKFEEVKSEFFLRKNYLTNWKNDGTYAFDEWFIFTKNIKKKIEESSLILEFDRLPFVDQKRFFITSNWFIIEENANLVFDIESNFDELTLILQVLDYQMTTFPLANTLIKKGKETKKFKFSPSLVILLKNNVGKIKITFLQSSINNFGKNQIVKITNLYSSDPCFDENICNKQGKCSTSYANKYKCQCNPEFVGKNCEFINKCVVEDEKKQTGLVYCKEHNGKDCIPQNDTFSCKCNKNYHWNKFIKDCQKVEKCFFKFCKKNEECLEKGKATCVCKNNFYRNKESQECEFDLCNNLPKEKKCPSNEKCLSVIGEKERRCFCPIENLKIGENCMNEKLIDNPFIKQLYKCSQTYKVVDGVIKCSCFDGYELDKNGITCKNDLRDKCIPKCDKKKQKCVLVNKDGKQTYECKCLLGLYGNDCENSYCNNEKNKAEIEHICGNNICQEKFENNDLKFICKCRREITRLDENGLCDLKNVCDLENIDRCVKMNAVCIVKLVDWKLKPMCVCTKGYILKDNKCEFACDIKSDDKSENVAYKDFCSFNFDENEKTYGCRNGFIWDDLTKNCYAGQNLFQVSFQIKLRTSDFNLKYETSSYNLNDYFCEQVSYKEKCVKKLNLERIKENKILKSDLLKDLRNKIENSIKKSFVNLIEPKSIKEIRVEKVINKGEIDYDNDGLNSIYDVELLINLDPQEKAEQILKNFEEACVLDKYNNNDNILDDNCLIMPYIYIIDSKFNIKEENLCDKNLVDCKKNSYCSLKIDKPTDYECVCSPGYEENFFLEKNNIRINYCVDIDECKDSCLNNCDPDSTECENFSGSYRCNCKENFKKINNTYCEVVCKNDKKCINGVCKVFEKNFEVCECFDGYKGLTCNKLDSKVIDLRTNLATVSIVLSLLMIIIVVKTFLYVKKIESEDEKHLTKNMYEMPMNNLDNTKGIKKKVSRSSSNITNEDSYSTTSQKNVTSF